jgi:hypothetical protein
VVLTSSSIESMEDSLPCSAQAKLAEDSMEIRSGFYLGGHRVKSGNSVLFSAPMELMLDFEDLWPLSYPDFDALVGHDVDYIARVAAVMQIASECRVVTIPTT